MLTYTVVKSPLPAMDWKECFINAVFPILRGEYIVRFLWLLTAFNTLAVSSSLSQKYSGDL
jgi:hypothetical protein